MKGDARKATERRRNFRRWASRIPDIETLIQLARELPEARREAFVDAAAPFVKFKFKAATN